MEPKKQLELFHVHQAYQSAGGPMDNEELYRRVQELAGIDQSQMDAKQPIGTSGTRRSPLKRRVRWYQQTLKAAGLIQKTDGVRGVWELSEPAGKDLDKALPDVHLVAYSTRLGAAVWGDCNKVFQKINEPIHLCLTSPPYPLRTQRNYGNVDEQQWVDFICNALEPIVSSLVTGGSVVLNVSNDIFLSGSPGRSMYLERMVIALNDRLGLSLMDRWVWHNNAKPPAPTQWACKERVQLCTGYEPVYWFTNDPGNVRSDNRRVLRPHTDNQKALIDRGGENRSASYGDGAYRLNPGNFSNQTAGSIPKNVISRGAACADTKKLHALARTHNLPRHPAMFPTDIAKFAIEFLTQPDELVVDPFSGSNKTGLACEQLNRRWLVTENILQYIQLQSLMFQGRGGYQSWD